MRSFYRMLAQLWLSDHASIARNNPMSPQGDQKGAISSDDAFEMNMQVVEQIMAANQSQSDYIKTV